jgi:hypothetical protein
LDCVVESGGFGTLGDAALGIGLGGSAGAVCSGTIQKTATASSATVAALAPSQIFFLLDIARDEPQRRGGRPQRLCGSEVRLGLGAALSGLEVLLSPALQPRFFLCSVYSAFLKNLEFRRHVKSSSFQLLL